MSGTVQTSTRTFTASNFQSEVINGSQPVLVDFWAEWCPPCRALTPTIDQLAEEVIGTARVGKLNVDENPAIATEYGIQSIPAVLVFKNGQVVERLIGVQAKETYAEAIANAS